MTKDERIIEIITSLTKEMKSVANQVPPQEREQDEDALTTWALFNWMIVKIAELKYENELLKRK